MILADENIDIRIIHALRKSGFDTYSIFEENRGISDVEVIGLAIEMNRILLTEDKDFGEWVFAHKAKGFSVVMLRYHFKDTSQIIEILKRLFGEKLNQLFGTFTTVTMNKIRIRNL
ncbi:MAG: DUF5615 family PIN-like protein [Bacteroidales bacterium]|nr:DUF5615 family PIN-like protein [Bacteroidales bacterium]MCF8458329.1 DUF5615 family PIN-like protein [Bacteroidales bacterium]